MLDTHQTVLQCNERFYLKYMIKNEKTWGKSELEGIDKFHISTVKLLNTIDTSIINHLHWSDIALLENPFRFLLKLKFTILAPGLRVVWYKVSIEITAETHINFCRGQIVKAFIFSFYKLKCRA